MDRPTAFQLRKLVGLANYQFGAGIGPVLFGGQLRVECSRRTGRIRHIFRRGHLLATLRPRDGYLALTNHGAAILLSKTKKLPNIVVVQNDVAEAVMEGGDVFAKHVAKANPNLRPAEEAIATDERGMLLGVGSAVLSGSEMMAFKRGVAVKLRRGVQESTKQFDGRMRSG